MSNKKSLRCECARYVAQTTRCQPNRATHANGVANALQPVLQAVGCKLCVNYAMLRGASYVGQSIAVGTGWSQLYGESHAAKAM
eukprot:698871-Pyramimonas_sp.AAC.1